MPYHKTLPAGAAVPVRARRHIVPCALLFLCFFSGMCCAAGIPGGGRTRTDTPVNDVSQKWIAVETSLLSYVASPSFARADELAAALGEFGDATDRFLHSPLYESSAVTVFSQREIILNIVELTELLMHAIADDRSFSQTGEMLKYAQGIRTELARWQHMDLAMADHIHMLYFYQFCVFITLIIIMTLFVWRLTLALENSRIKGKRSEAFSRQMVLAQEQERSRIARELHDSVAQDLSALEMQVSQITAPDSAGNADRTRELCAELSAGLAGLIDRVRAICNDLIPPEFRHCGLTEALQRLCFDFERTTHIECRLTVGNGFSVQPMPVDMQLQCFRLVQEALTNIRKHAEASEVTVLLRNADFGGDDTKPGLLICVSDDGRGFDHPLSASDAGRYPAGHFGIRGMYERIMILDGMLSYISEEGEGTMVKIEVPLQ